MNMQTKTYSSKLLPKMMGILLLALIPTFAIAAEEGVGFFRSILDAAICGPSGKMCDKNYNPNAANAMIESPEALMKMIDAAENYLNSKRDTPTPARNNNFVANKSAVAVTAKPPTVLNLPLDNDSFQKLIKSNGGLGLAVQSYMQNQTSSISALKMYAEGGDPWGQLFYGLAYSDSWTGIANPAESCRWIRESATAGVSSARFFIAQKAYARSDCFSETPTLDQAKTWAELASLSNDQSVKTDALELIQKILKEQLTSPKK
jgi:hypothetical protein